MGENHLEDVVLIERYRRGDRRALEQLFCKHRRRAFHFAHSLTGSHEEAGDVVAEAFLRVCKSVARFEGKGPFTTWLFRILTNCHYDIRKKRSYRSTISLDVYTSTAESEADRLLEDTNACPFELVASATKSEALLDAVSELPEIQSALVVLYLGETMSYDEMAQALNLPLGTVKSRLNRARLSLATRLEGQEEMFSVA